MSNEGPYKNGQPAELIRHCKRCHRKLKNPKSMKAGYGPVCAKKTEHAEAKDES
jgi:hypothetical protein